MFGKGSPASARARGSSSSGSSSHHKPTKSTDISAATLNASDDAAKAERKQRRQAAKAQAAAEAIRVATALDAELEEQAAAADAEAVVDESADGTSDGDDAADEERELGSDAEHSSATADSASEHSSDDDLADITTPAGMQAALISLMKQRKADKAAAKASRTQIEQLQAQLQTQATSTVRFGVVRNTIASLAPASRSTLKTEPGVAARQQTAAAAAPSLQQRQKAVQAAERARMPEAPGVQAAMRAAPPRLALPEVKQELEAKALSADPTLLKSWVFQMERLLTALEDASEQPYTFGDRLKLARRYWDQGMEAWWTTLCEARASEGLPAVCSWAGLLAALRETYAPVSDGLAVGREIQQLKQGPSESMEAYVRRVLELQGRVSSADWPSHVVAMLTLNGVDESRYPWTTTHVRNALAEFANTRGRSADMAYLAHQLRTQASSEPKFTRGAGSGSAELANLKAELAKLQRQMAHGAQVAHTAAVRTSGADLAESSKGNTSAGGMGQGRTKRPGKPTGKRMSSAERQRCYDNELCFFCKKSGHVSRECPERAAAKAKQQLQQQGAEGAPSSEN